MRASKRSLTRKTHLVYVSSNNLSQKLTLNDFIVEKFDGYENYFAKCRAQQERQTQLLRYIELTQTEISQLKREVDQIQVHDNPPSHDEQLL
jgi:hypothetical protein